MVMRKNYSGSIMPQSLLDYLSWINTGLGECSPKQLFARNQAVLRIQPEGKKHFVSKPSQM